MFARGYPRFIFWSGLISLSANVLLNIVLIPRYGINGAAIATSISYTLNFVILVTAFVRLTGAPLVSLVIPRLDDIRLLMGGLRAMIAGKDSDL